MQTPTTPLSRSGATRCRYALELRLCRGITDLSVELVDYPWLVVMDHEVSQRPVVNAPAVPPGRLPTAFLHEQPARPVRRRGPQPLRRYPFRRWPRREHPGCLLGPLDPWPTRRPLTRSVNGPKQYDACRITQFYSSSAEIGYRWSVQIVRCHDPFESINGLKWVYWPPPFARACTGTIGRVSAVRRIGSRVITLETLQYIRYAGDDGAFLNRRLLGWTCANSANKSGTKPPRRATPSQR